MVLNKMKLNKWVVITAILILAIAGSFFATIAKADDSGANTVSTAIYVDPNCPIEKAELTAFERSQAQE
jgi:hypothetical protein